MSLRPTCFRCHSEQSLSISISLLREMANSKIDLRVNVTRQQTGLWVNTIYVIYRRPAIETPRILEGDMIQLWGESRGIATYTSIQGKPVQVPGVAASAIERVKP